MASKVVNCSSNAAISSMESRRVGFYKRGADWRSGYLTNPVPDVGVVAWSCHASGQDITPSYAVS